MRGIEIPGEQGRTYGGGIMERRGVAVIGNAGIDTNIYPYSGDIDFSVESNFTRNVDCIGQAGGYGSLGFRRLGYATSFIGALGDDFAGRHIMETFKNLGIDVSALFTDPQGTARSVNFMYGDGRRKNFYDGKGHMALKPPMDLCREVLEKVRLAHFNIPDWARDLLPVAKETGIVVSADLQDIVSIGDPYRADFVRFADILFFSSTNYQDPSPVFDHLSSFGEGKILIAGMGSRGCAVYRGGSVSYFPPVPMSRPVIDTNGAGDSLAVGFLSSYVLEDFSLEESILRGQIAARHACTVTGPDDLITGSGLDEHFRRCRE